MVYICNQNLPWRTVSGRVDKVITPLVRNTKPFFERELAYIDPMHLAPYSLFFILKPLPWKIQVVSILVSHLQKLLVEVNIENYLRASPISMCFSIFHHKGKWFLIHVCAVFHLVSFTSLGTQHLWMELHDWITKNLLIFLCRTHFSML